MAARIYALENILKELRTALSSTYSLSPEGRAYLIKIDDLLCNKEIPPK